MCILIHQSSEVYRYILYTHVYMLYVCTYVYGTIFVYVYVVYIVYLANIKFGKLECNTNWQTFSLTNRAILSVHRLLHNTHDNN